MIMHVSHIHFVNSEFSEILSNYVQNLLEKSSKFSLSFSVDILEEPKLKLLVQEPNAFFEDLLHPVHSSDFNRPLGLSLKGKKML